MEKKMSCCVIAFVIALLVFEDHYTAADNECQVGYELFQESCYWLSNTEATRPAAAAACSPGHLVDITSEQEQDFIANLLADADVNDAWFGLLKSLSWLDQSSLVQEAWQHILADEGQRCFILDRIAFSYVWNDIGCDEAYQSICEYENSDSKNCSSGFKKFQSSCYHLNKNRTESAAACSTSHLVHITSLEENKFVVALLEKYGEGRAWIGLTLSHPPSWSDGSLLSPGNWYKIITDGQSICYRLVHQGSRMYRWDDAPSSSCLDRYRYVCEIEAVTSVSSTSHILESTITTTNSLNTSTTDNGVFAQTNNGISTSTSKSTVALGIQQRNKTRAIVGSLFGVALFLVAIATAIWFVLRQRKRDQSKSQSPGKVPSVSAETTREPEHNNPTYAIDAEAATDDEAHQYNTVHDQQGEYTYIESNAPGKGDEHIYAETAADRKSSHTSNKDLPDEGWKDNTIYVTSDETPPTQNAEEGWADNSVYGK